MLFCFKWHPRLMITQSLAPPRHRTEADSGPFDKLWSIRLCVSHISKTEQWQKWCKRERVMVWMKWERGWLIALVSCRQGGNLNANILLLPLECGTGSTSCPLHPVRLRKWSARTPRKVTELLYQRLAVDDLGRLCARQKCENIPFVALKNTTTLCVKFAFVCAKPLLCFVVIFHSHLRRSK